MNYFIFNKISDYTRGYMENSLCNHNSLWMRNNSSGKTGVFFSRILDSREKGTVWHRMVMESEAISDASIQFSFYASDSLEVKKWGEDITISEILHHPDLTAKEKKRILSPYFVKLVLNPKDILLHEVKGRYFWFLAELFGQEKKSPIIRNIQIFFPKESWISYLPDLYQADADSASFLERYLLIFQSLYEDLKTEIVNSAGYLEPGAVNHEFLQWLASWLDIGNTYVWSKKQLKNFLNSAMELFKKRGTRQGLIQMVELYTGETPFVVEHYAVERYGLELQYGDNSNAAFLLLRESCVPSIKEYNALRNIIEDVKPAHMEVKIIVLKPCIFLQKYTYSDSSACLQQNDPSVDRHSSALSAYTFIGINSVLGRYRALSLDGLSLLPFTVVGGESRREGEREFEKS